jgi:hypothetical protein
VKAYRILSYSSDGEYVANLQEMLEMSIGIFRGLAAEWALLHHIDESWFYTTKSDTVMKTNPSRVFRVILSAG